MEAHPADRNSRALPRTGAAVLVLLAALMHLLVCGHGETAPGAAPRGVVQAVPLAATAGHTDSGQHDLGEHCCGGDEPIIRASRDIGPSGQSAHEAVPVMRVADLSAPMFRPKPSPGPPAVDISVGHTLARLGVWRT
jgi:hypothetical protein